MFSIIHKSRTQQNIITPAPESMHPIALMAFRRLAADLAKVPKPDLVAARSRKGGLRQRKIGQCLDETVS